MPADPPTPILPDDPPPPHRPPHRTRGTWVTLIVVLALLAAGAWYWWGRDTTDAGSNPAVAKKGGGSFGQAGGAGRGGRDPRTVMPVTVKPATTREFIVYQNAIGNVAARSTVTVQPRVDGQLARVLFREGQMVKAGDLLAEIDPRPFEVQVAQANGQLARDQAQLANARIDLQRYQTLFAQDSIAKQQVDTQAALVRQLEGTIEADRGAVDSAKLQLSYTRIVAPAGGRTGLRQVDAGNMVRQSDTNGIVVITQVQPISVVYSIPEDRLGAVLRSLSTGANVPVDAYDRDNKIKLAAGKLVTADNQIDPATGTIKLKAEFSNENGALFPNQFVNVRMQVDVLHNAIVIPTPAVQRGSAGTFVYRVNDDDTVTVRPVKIGPAEGEVTVIESGVAAGERVVTDGADKLRDGAKIEPIVPGAENAKAPAPANGKGGQGRRKGDATTGGARSDAAAPTTPAGATPAGNAPSTNAPPAGAPVPPPRAQGAPSG